VCARTRVETSSKRPRTFSIGGFRSTYTPGGPSSQLRLEGSEVSCRSTRWRPDKPREAAGRVFEQDRTHKSFARSRTASEDKDARHGAEDVPSVGHAFKAGVGAGAPGEVGIRLPHAPSVYVASTCMNAHAGFRPFRPVRAGDRGVFAELSESGRRLPVKAPRPLLLRLPPATLSRSWRSRRRDEPVPRFATVRSWGRWRSASGSGCSRSWPTVSSAGGWSTP
jgi:hypothetical protein